MRAKKFVSLLLCLAMLLSLLVPSAMAAATTNVDVTVDRTTVAAGETFTVTISNKAMSAYYFTGGIVFDKEKLECVSIVSDDPAEPDYFCLEKTAGGKNPYFNATVSSVSQANSNGKVGIVSEISIKTEEPPVAVKAKVIAVVTFRAKANASGTTTISSYESTDCSTDNSLDVNIEAGGAGSVIKEITIEAAKVPVTGVTLNVNTLTLDIGDTATLVATVQPDGASDKTVTFKSSKESVATVDANGKVTAVAEGTATITVTTKDGNFTDTCVVTVACSHDYTKEDMNAQGALKTEGDCQNQAVYYKSCTKCGKVSTTETFFGEKNPNKHVDAEATWTKTADKHSKTWKCCDAVDMAEESHEWGNDSVCDECGYGCTQHVGGTASCVQKATCDHCGQPYGDFAPHSFTVETKSQQTLKTAGTCKVRAVYYKTCSVDGCGVIATDDAYTFEGELDPNNHVGQTEIVNAKPADHKTQTKGYTGDTRCLDCGEIIANGQEIIPEAHKESLIWTTDGTNHWKVCSVDGCDVVIDGTTKAHYSNKAENKATCNAPAKCDACGVSYGQKLNHVPATTWSKDASGHWHECQNGCGEQLDFAQHTACHGETAAIEDHSVVCSCGWMIFKQLEHECKFDQRVVDDTYLAAAATCVSPAKYYMSCRCTIAGTETFDDPAGTLDPNNHNWATEWSGADNPDNHWHACLNGCGEKNDVTVHDYKMKFDSTKHWEECVCGRKINEGNHIDTDKNDKCDTCGRDMLKPGPSHFGHWDYNGDGRCDYCGAKTGCTHTDANKDGKCDYCSSNMKDIESAKTLDAGILMYAGMAVLAATGSAAMIGKKRKEQ